MKSTQKREEFKLRISGVELGKHSYSIDCDETFFELAAIPTLTEGNVNLQIEMEIFEKMLTIDFHFQGAVLLPCARCLDPVTVNLDFNDQLIVKLMPFLNEKEEDDNLWLINENDYAVDVFHFVYEAFTLALPTQVLHAEDENGNSTCNPLILEKLAELSHHDKKDEEIDPRWEALKQIKKS